MGEVIICSPDTTCRDPHTLRWYCMRGHADDNGVKTPGVCPLPKCLIADRAAAIRAGGAE